MLGVMIPGRRVRMIQCGGFERIQGVPCPRSDRKHYLRRRRHLQCSLYILTCPPPTKRLQPRFHSVYLTFTNGTNSLTYPSQPFITSPHPLPTLHHSVPAPLRPLPQTQGWVNNSADFKKNCISLGGRELYVLDVRRRVCSCLPQFNIPSWGRGHLAAHLETQ